MILVKIKGAVKLSRSNLVADNLLRIQLARDANLTLVIIHSSRRGSNLALCSRSVRWQWPRRVNSIMSLEITEERKRKVGSRCREKKENGRGTHAYYATVHGPLSLSLTHTIHNNLQRHSFIRGSFNSTEVAAEARRLGLRVSPPSVIASV